MYNQMKRGFLKKGLDPESKPPTPKPGPEPIVNAGTQALSTLSVDDGIYGQMKRGFLKQGASGRPSAKGVPASSTGASPLSEEITDAKGGRFQIVCPADQCKSKAEQPGVITLRLSPCYCTYAAGGRESSLLMIGSRAELEEAIPFAEAALQQPLPPQGPHPFRIADAGKKGLGMFATRAIKAGELIIAERPLVVSSPTSHGTKHEIAYTRPFYDAALTALSEPARTALLDLADTCSLGPPEHTHPLPGRLMTNAYSCGPLTATNAVPDDADIAKGEGVPWNATYATLPRVHAERALQLEPRAVVRPVLRRARHRGGHGDHEQVCFGPHPGGAARALGEDTFVRVSVRELCGRPARRRVAQRHTEAGGRPLSAHAAGGIEPEGLSLPRSGGDTQDAAAGAGGGHDGTICRDLVGGQPHHASAGKPACGVAMGEGG